MIDDREAVRRDSGCCARRPHCVARRNPRGQPPATLRACRRRAALRNRRRRSRGRLQISRAASPRERYCCSSSENRVMPPACSEQLCRRGPADAHQVRHRSRCAARLAESTCRPTSSGAITQRRHRCRRRPQWPRRARDARKIAMPSARACRRRLGISFCSRANRRSPATRTPCECSSRQLRIRLQIGRHDHARSDRERRHSGDSSRTAPDASSTPGKSLLRNTAGCSMTPVAKHHGFRTHLGHAMPAPPAPPNDRRNSRPRPSR